MDLLMSSGSARPDLLAVLIDAGAARPTMTAPIAAALGRIDALKLLLRDATPDERQQAFGLAVINRQLEAARLCLDTRADPNQPLPVHRHSMPLHEATLHDDVDMMKLLIGRGARIDTRDTLWDGTPLGWAVHNKKARAEAYLRSLLPGPG